MRVYLAAYNRCTQPVEAIQVKQPDRPGDEPERPACDRTGGFREAGGADRELIA